MQFWIKLCNCVLVVGLLCGYQAIQNHRTQEEEIAKLAAHQATMVIFLSTGLLEGLQERLMAGGYSADTPAAIVYKASWPDQKVFRCTVSTLAQTAKENKITKTALILVGNFLGGSYSRSKLYDPSFTTEFRQAKQQETR